MSIRREVVKDYYLYSYSSMYLDIAICTAVTTGVPGNYIVHESGECGGPQQKLLALLGYNIL